jgi:polysaccharide deacetylase 2 family uncharacterized protein YibQ
MASKRKHSARYRHKNGGGLNLTLTILAALAVFGLIYWISKPPSALQISKAKEKIKRKLNQTEVANKKDKTDAEIREHPEIETKTKTGIEQAIYTAAGKLHIDETGIRKKTDGDLITISVPVDPSLSDLTFANMIFKGEVEKQNGIFESGLEKGSRQIIVFSDPKTSQKVNLELYYKRSPATAKPDKKLLAIIVDDFGNYSGKLLSSFARTDPAVSFAVLPDTRYAEDALLIAHQHGHETLIHIPMEPLNYPVENPGDRAIFIQLSPGEITRRMERFVDKLPGCIGANNHMGSLATADEPAMQAVMQVLRKHNLLFVDSRTTNSSVAYKTAQKNLVPAYKRDIFLDEPDLSDANLDKKLAECNTLAQSRPYVIAIMHCHSADHLNYLNRFITRAEQTGFKLLPLSKLGAYKLPQIQ